MIYLKQFEDIFQYFIACITHMHCILINYVYQHVFLLYMQQPSKIFSLCILSYFSHVSKLFFIERF